MYADTASGRAEASPGLAGTCPSCGHPCRPKCGKVNVWHWAHHARADCDPWSEPMTEWHRGWQLAVPPERREVVMGPHRADIVTASGGVVEVQHSSVPVDVIAAREEFYGERMAWIFDATRAGVKVRSSVAPASGYGLCGCQAGVCSKLWLPSRCRDQHPAGWREKGRGQVLFRWSHPRRSVQACRRPVFLDLGNGTVLQLPEQVRLSGEQPGMLYTRASVEGWLREGGQLERARL